MADQDGADRSRWPSSGVGSVCASAPIFGERAEDLILHTYSRLYATAGFGIPALIPQVYVHYDPFTRRELGLGVAPALTRQRMDFLLLLPKRVRVVLELDGREHYTNESGGAEPKRYAAMVAEDRTLRLAGYEVYRFGGHELADRDSAARMLTKFFWGAPQSPRDRPGRAGADAVERTAVLI